MQKASATIGASPVPCMGSVANLRLLPAPITAATRQVVAWMVSSAAQVLVSALDKRLVTQDACTKLITGDMF